MTADGDQRQDRGGGVALGYFTPITDARPGASTELHSRQVRYTITMAFRTACFIAMIFVPGTFRWVLFVCALFLPYIAVIFANQANVRQPGVPVGGASPTDAPAITTGPEISDAIADDVPGSEDVQAHSGGEQANSSGGQTHSGGGQCDADQVGRNRVA